MTRKKIFIIEDRIQENLRKGDRELPVFGLKNGRVTSYGNEVSIKDQRGKEVAKLVYNPDKPLKGGQQVWLEIIDSDADIT